MGLAWLVKSTNVGGAGAAVLTYEISCLQRTSLSLSDILDLGHAFDLGAEMRTEKLRGMQIHLLTEKLAQFPLDRKERQPRNKPRLKLDENIYIALGREIAAQDRSEQGEPADMVPSAKLGEFLAVNRDLGNGSHKRTPAKNGAGLIIVEGRGECRRRRPKPHLFLRRILNWMGVPVKSKCARSWFSRKR